MATRGPTSSCGRPLDTIVFQSPVVEIGKFRVWPCDPRFHDTGPIQRHIVVFPRTLVRIAHEGASAFIAGPELVTYYNRGQIYRRDSVNGLPDRCEWFAFAPQVLAEALGRHDASATENPESPFRFSFGPSDPASYLRQRRVVEALAADPDVDEMEVEEEMLGVLNKLLDQAYRRRESTGPRSPRQAGEHRDRDLAEEAKESIARSFRRHVGLSEIAVGLDVSVFQLCRAFRRWTGMTLHGFRSRLRLAASLDRLAQRPFDLTEVALDLGFSSHSHFTALFRREFGMTPSAFRRDLSRKGPPSPPAARSTSQVRSTR